MFVFFYRVVLSPCNCCPSGEALQLFAFKSQFLSH